MKKLFLLPLVYLYFLMPGMAQTFYHTGNEDPVDTDHLPGIVLAGGAGDNDDAMLWMLSRAAGGDVVVLRASGADGYNPYFYHGFAGDGIELNSVTSIVITSSEEADDPAVLTALNNAEVVFIAGGNQWNYIDHWRGTEMLNLLNRLVDEKGITIGGTSAGMAVLGEVVFTAENLTVFSSEALGNPYHFRVALEKGFLEIPFLHNTVTDSHYNRVHTDGMNRHGRHVAFMARMAEDWEMPSRGIAANEYTAIAVDGQGIARVFGHPGYDDHAYFLKQYGGPPEVCEPGTPLTWDRDEKALRVYRVKGDYEGSGWFDLAAWEEGEGGEWHYWYVREGELFQIGEEDATGAELLPAGSPAIRAYPSPARDILTVAVDPGLLHQNVSGVALQVVAPCGTVVRSDVVSPGAVHPERVTTVSFSVGDLVPGVYMVRYNDGNRTGAVRWIKQ